MHMMANFELCTFKAVKTQEKKKSQQAMYAKAGWHLTNFHIQGKHIADSATQLHPNTSHARLHEKIDLGSSLDSQECPFLHPVSRSKAFGRFCIQGCPTVTFCLILQLKSNQLPCKGENKSDPSCWSLTCVSQIFVFCLAVNETPPGDAGSNVQGEAPTFHAASSCCNSGRPEDSDWAGSVWDRKRLSRGQSVGERSG